MTTAVLFPGQGSQTPGMGADLFEARPDLLGESADAVLGWSLRDVCLDGSPEELTRTDRAQPALFAVCYALWEEVRDRTSQPPVAAAGHSLGEYTALAAAGAMGFADGLRLVAARGAAMQEASGREPSGMAALLGADLAAAERLTDACRHGGGRLWVANVNAPGQVVVAGGADDIDWAARHAAEHGVRRVIPLKVAGAFHSPFMAPAVTRLEAAVAAVSFAPPSFRVWANTTAEPHGEDVAATLLAQLTSPVRFSETLAGMAEAGVTTFVHIGPGDVTAGLARRSVQGAETVVVSSLDDLAALP